MAKCNIKRSADGKVKSVKVNLPVDTFPFLDSSNIVDVVTISGDQFNLTKRYNGVKSPYTPSLMQRVIDNVTGRLGLSSEEYSKRLSIINATRSVDEEVETILNRTLDGRTVYDYSDNVEILNQSPEVVKRVEAHLEDSKDKLLVRALSESKAFITAIDNISKTTNPEIRRELNAAQKQLGELYRNKEGNSPQAETLKEEISSLKTDLKNSESPEKIFTTEEAKQILEKEFNQMLNDISTTDKYLIKDFSDKWLKDSIEYAKKNRNELERQLYQNLLDNKGGYEYNQAISSRQSEQRSALKENVDYLKNTTEYPIEFKHLILQEILTKNINNEGYVARRTEQTVGLHNGLSSGVLPSVYDAVKNNSNTDLLKVYQENRLKSFLSKQEINEIVQKYKVESRPEGTWIKFPQNASTEVINDMYLIAKESHAHPAQWCTGGSVGTAKSHNDHGDFYFFVNNDQEVRLAMRYNGSSKLAESRGLGGGQVILPEDLSEARHFYDNYPGGQKFIDTWLFNDFYQRLVVEGQQIKPEEIEDFERVKEEGDGSYNEFTYKDEELINTVKKQDVYVEYYSKKYNIPVENIANESLDIKENTELLIGNILIEDNNYIKEPKNLKYVIGNIEDRSIYDINYSYPNIEFISGNLYLEYGTLELPNLNKVGGHVNLRYYSKKLINLKELGGSLKTEGYKYNLNSLDKIGGFADFKYWIGSAPKLEKIGGFADFRDWKGSAANLKEIGGDALFDGWKGNANNLKKIGGTAEFRNWQGTAKSLEEIGNDALFIGWMESAPNLKRIGGNAEFMNWKGIAPNLEKIGGELKFMVDEFGNPLKHLSSNAPVLNTVEGKITFLKGRSGKGGFFPYLDKLPGDKDSPTNNEQLNQDNRAAIVRQKDLSYIILGKNADDTSPLHELAHEYERVLTAKERKDILDWAGHNSWSVETSEAFAVGFEKYLYEGKSSKKEEDIFKKFANYLKEIIQDAISYFGGLNELNQEMQDIYGTMLEQQSPQIEVLEQPIQETVLNQSENSSWISNSLKGIKEVKQNSATPSQWVKMISDKGGKGTSQELEWIGLQEYLEEWLGNNKVKSIPKNIVEDYIKTNKINIQEVTKGKESVIITQDEDQDNYYNVYAADDPEGQYRGDIGGVLYEDGLYKLTTGDLKMNFKSLKDVKEHLNKVSSYSYTTKYTNYAVPGYKNYREILLTMPSSEKVYNVEDYADFPEEVTNAFDNAENPEDGFEVARRLEESGYEVIEQSLDGDFKRFRKKNTEKLPPFTSSHWNETNILAHIRLDERVLPNGERVLFINEIQSDWAQEGRRDGFLTVKNLKQTEEFYKDRDRYRKLIIEKDELRKVLEEDTEFKEAKELLKQEGFFIGVGLDKDNESKVYKEPYSRKAEAIEEIELPDSIKKAVDIIEAKGKRLTDNTIEQEEIISKYGGTVDIFNNQIELKRPKALDNSIPDMPYKKTDQWAGLAVRRVLKMAADQGYDRVSWVTGAQIQEIVGGDLKGQEQFYNNILPKIVKKEASRFDKKAKIDVIDFREDRPFRLKTKSGEKLGNFSGSTKVKDVINQVVTKTGLKESDIEVEIVELPQDNIRPDKQLSVKLTDKFKGNINKGITLYSKEKDESDMTPEEKWEAIQMARKINGYKFVNNNYNGEKQVDAFILMYDIASNPDNPNNELASKMIDKLASYSEPVTVNFTDNPVDLGYNRETGEGIVWGSFNAETREINVLDLASTSSIETSILHEILHLLTHNSIENREELSSELESARKRLNALEGFEYQTSNVHEMVTAFFTEPDFREAIKNLSDREKSFFETIIDKIKNFLGLSTQTEYEQVESIVNKTFDEATNEVYNSNKKSKFNIETLETIEDTNDIRYGRAQNITFPTPTTIDSKTAQDLIAQPFVDTMEALEGYSKIYESADEWQGKKCN